MGGWPRRLFRIVLTPLLYFGAAVLGWTVLSLPVRVDAPGTVILPAVVGFAAAMVLFGLGIRFIRAYVFGHELTHWLTAKVFRKKTGRFQVGRHGGSVEVEDPNAIIVLAPYFVPVYTLALVGIYGIVKLVADPVPGWGIILFCGSVGASYAFHLVLTWLSLKAGQQDLRLCGPIFSVGVILLGNLGLMFLVVVVVGRHWDTAFTELWNHSRALWELTVAGVAWTGRWLRHPRHDSTWHFNQ